MVAKNLCSFLRGSSRGVQIACGKVSLCFFFFLWALSCVSECVLGQREREICFTGLLRKEDSKIRKQSRTTNIQANLSKMFERRNRLQRRVVSPESAFVLHSFPRIVFTLEFMWNKCNFLVGQKQVSGWHFLAYEETHRHTFIMKGVCV